MKILGVKNGKDVLNWIVIDGTTRDNAVVIEHGENSAPAGKRADQLAWVRREVLELVARHAIDNAAVRSAEAGTSGAPNFARAELDGVVLASLSESSVPVDSYRSASVRSRFGRTKAAAEIAQSAIPSVNATTKSRRDQLVVALCALPG